MNNAHWFFTQFPQPITALPVTLTLKDPELLHHLKTVMRARSGAKLVLVDNGIAYNSIVETLEGKTLTVRLEAMRPSPSKTGIKTLAAVSLIKGQRWDWMIQKLTELGVDEIIPLEAERSIIDVKNPESKLARWAEITRNAAQQSERLHLPVLHPPCKPAQLPDDDGLIKLVASERGGHPLHDACQEVTPQTKGVLFAVGPEGGWSENELTQLSQKGFHAVHFGDTIFRSETAAIYLQSVLHYVCQTHTPAC